MRGSSEADPRRTPDPFRVLFVTPGRPDGNNMVFARASAEELRRLGLEVDEFYLLSRTHPIRVLLEFIRLRKHIRQFDPLIVHAQYGGITAFVSVAAAGRRTKFVSVRGSDLNLAPSLGWLRGRVTRMLTLTASLLADEIVCVSRALKEQLGRVGRRAHVIPDGVDTTVFFPADQHQARVALKLPPAIPMVLFNAAQAPILKGLPLVQSAMEAVRTVIGDVHLHVTRGEHSREEVAMLMAAADCLVLASESEGSPNVVKESMATNLPVVSVPVGDVAERLADVTPSCIVDRNPAALAKGIIQILSLHRRSDGSRQIRAQRLTQADSTSDLGLLYTHAAGCPDR